MHWSGLSREPRVRYRGCGDDARDGVSANQQFSVRGGWIHLWRHATIVSVPAGSVSQEAELYNRLSGWGVAPVATNQVTV